MVTHDPKAAAHAHRMVHLEKGVLVDQPHSPESEASARVAP